MLNRASRMYYTWLLMMIIALTTEAQSVRNVNASINGTELHITYQIRDLRQGQKFNAALYSSTDNFKTPIINGTAGAIGYNLNLLSQNLIVISEPVQTLGFITNDISFKVVITLVYNPITLDYPTSFFKIKRGNELDISWTGGLEKEQVNFDLYRNGSLVQKDFHVTRNYQSTSIKIPKLEKGEGYRLEFYTASAQTPIQLPDFQVKKRNGWIAWLFIIAAGYAAYDYTQEGFIYGLFNK